MLYLLRHGQTDWNIGKKIQGQYDVPLNALGQWEATSAADSLKLYNIDKIISSDLSRAADTAKIVGNALNIDVTYDARLREYDFGKLTGKAMDTITPTAARDLITNAAALGAEPVDVAFRRVAGFIQDIDWNRNTLVVTHGMILRYFMGFFEFGGQFDVQKYVQKYANRHIGNATIFRIKCLESKLERLR